MSSALIVNEPKMKSEDVDEKEADLRVLLIKKRLRKESFILLKNWMISKNQSMAYIARKFSYIRFKKNKLKPRKYT